LNEYNLYPFFKVEGYTVNYNDIRVEMLCWRTIKGYLLEKKNVG
jgi:hypothetical protein